MARKTSEQRLAEANTARLRAEFDILAERAAAVGLSAKQVAAIRRALDLFDLLGWGADEIADHEAHLAERIDALEDATAAARQRRGEDGSA